MVSNSLQNWDLLGHFCQPDGTEPPHLPLLCYSRSWAPTSVTCSRSPPPSREIWALLVIVALLRLRGGTKRHRAACPRGPRSQPLTAQTQTTAFTLPEQKRLLHHRAPGKHEGGGGGCVSQHSLTHTLYQGDLRWRKMQSIQMTSKYQDKHTEMNPVGYFQPLPLYFSSGYLLRPL